MLTYRINEIPDKVFDTQRACSHATRLPLTMLRAAKAAGCPGFFTNGDISWGEAKPWILEHLPELESKADDNYEKWRLRKLKAETLSEELYLDKDKGKFLDRDDVASVVKSIVQAQKSLLNSLLVQDLPAKLVGLAEPQIRNIQEKVVQDVCQIMRQIDLLQDPDDEQKT